MKNFFSFLNTGSLYASSMAHSFAGAGNADQPAEKSARRKNIEEWLLAAFVVFGLMAILQLALAGVTPGSGGSGTYQADPDTTTFAPVVTMLKGWMSGSYGMMIVFAVLAVGLAMTVFKYSLMWLAVAVGVAIAAVVGPDVSEKIFTATL